MTPEGLWVGRRPWLWCSLWGLERGRGTLSPLEPGRGPCTGPVGGSPTPPAARLWRKERRPWEPASRPRRPPSPTLLPGCAGGASSGSRAAAGTASPAGPAPPPEDLLEKRARGRSVRQPRGQAAGPRPWSSGLRPAPWHEPPTSPRCSCLEGAPRSPGGVILFVALPGGRYTFKGSLSSLSSLPLPSAKFSSRGMLVFLLWAL